MAGLTTTQKIKSPLSALTAQASYGGAAPAATLGSTATPAATAALADWFSRPAATPWLTPQARADYPAALQKKAVEQQATQDVAGYKAQSDVDLDAQKQLLDYQQYIQSQGAAPGAAAPAGGGTSPAGTPTTSGGGGLTIEQLKQLITEFGLNTPSGPAAPVAPVPAPAAPATVSLPGAPDTGAAEAATWARAKDKIGRQTAGAVQSLKELQAARGFGAESGVYANEEQNVLSEGLRSLGDVSRQQAEDALAAQRDREKLAYEGGITQRGQDIGVFGTGFSGLISQRGQDISQRGQDISSQQEALRARLAALGLLPSLASLLNQAAY